MDTRHRYFMSLYHHYTDTVVHSTWYYMLHWPLLLQVLVIHRYVTRIIATLICYTDTRICYMDTLIHWILLHGYSVRYYSMFIPRYIDSLVYMHWLFLLHGSLYILHDLLFMDIPVFSLHDYFLLLILICPLMDMWAVDMWCVELSATWIQATRATSKIPHLLFPISRYLILCYQQSSGPVIMFTCTMHHTCSCYVMYPNYNKDNLRIGETWRLIRSYREDILDPYLSHCRDGSTSYRLHITPKAPVSRFLLPS